MCSVSTYRVSVSTQRRSGRADIGVDLGLAVVVLAAAELAIGTGQEVGSAPRDWFAYVLGGAMAAPVLLRRRHPMVELYLMAGALLLFYVLGYPGFPPAAVLAVPLYDAAHAGRVRPALPVPVLFLGIGMVVVWRKGTAPLDVVEVFLPQFGLVAVAMLLGALVRSRRAYAEEAQRRLRAVEAEREQLAQARVVQERLRIARELHDTVAHAITTITVQSGYALHTIDAEPQKTRTEQSAHEALVAIRQTGKDALTEMRSTLAVLRSDAEPVATENAGGLERLPELLTAVRAAGLEVTLQPALPDARDGLPEAVDHAAYRIVQESLTNVLRHAGPAARAQISLTVEPECLDIEICDDGGGRPPVAGHGGHGLAGMAERVAAVGGRFEAGPQSGGGFKVTACLPLPDA